MKKLHFNIDIQSSVEKVYDTMLGISSIKSYEKWTSVFNPTSTYEGNWKKDSKMYFVGFDESGKRGGMVSEIAENIPFKFVSIRHIGMLDETTEITEGPEIDSWAGCLENYSFQEQNGVTSVSIEIDVIEEHQDFFESTWPNALNMLKEQCEK